jgi:polysaccharide pyruvyl transferase WcaK-like protein
MNRVAIVNAYDDENRGSAALNIAAIDIVRRSLPRAVIGLITIRDYDNLRRQDGYRHTLAAHPDVQVLPPLLGQWSLALGSASAIPAEISSGRMPRRLLSTDTADFLDSADLVISRGGVVYYCAPGIRHTAAFLRRTSAMRRAAHQGQPTFFLGLHLGVLHGRHAVRSTRHQLTAAAGISVRGPLSQTRLNGLGVTRPSSVVPDSVFGLDRSELPEPPQEGNGRVAVVVSESARSVLPQIKELIHQLRTKGVVDGVDIVVQVTDVDSDRRAAGDLAAGVPGSRLIDDDLSPSDLIRLYGQAQLLISSRLHAAIFGLLGGTPSFPLQVSGDGKAMDVMDELHLAGLVLSPGDVSQWSRVVIEELSRGRSRVAKAADEASDRIARLSLGTYATHS